MIIICCVASEPALGVFYFFPKMYTYISFPIWRRRRELAWSLFIRSERNSETQPAHNFLQYGLPNSIYLMENILLISSDRTTYNKFFVVDLESSLENNYYGKMTTMPISTPLLCIIHQKPLWFLPLSMVLVNFLFNLWLLAFLHLIMHAILLLLILQVPCSGSKSHMILSQ